MNAPRTGRSNAAPGLPHTEDWWAALIGLLLVIVAASLFRAGYGLQPFVAVPNAWSSFSDLHAQLAADLPRYAALTMALVCLFVPAAIALGRPPFQFAAAFVFLLLLALFTVAIGAWAPARSIGLEQPMIALLLGALLGNGLTMPSWLKEGLRAELYIKTGIVLLGASMPLPLLRLAGPIALFQASFVSILTFATIYGVARFLGVDRRLGAMLGAGGSICGVSAVLAVAGATRARREDVSIATAMVVLWAIVMIGLLPVLARAWYLPFGIAGAWIGSSEYADAAGIAAVQVYRGIQSGGALMGSPDQALWAFTMVKVIGRDMWIGLWAAAISVYAVFRWDPTKGNALDFAQIWHRFPKFIIGFILASALITWADGTLDLNEFTTIVRPRLIEPLNALRDLTFTLSFLSIGASMRLRSLVPVGGNAFIAFATGVVVNLVLGFVLSALVFPDYWSSIGQ